MTTATSQNPAQDAKFQSDDNRREQAAQQQNNQKPVSGEQAGRGDMASSTTAQTDSEAGAN